MNKDERKRLINAFYGVNRNKELEKNHINSKYLKSLIKASQNTIYADTDSIIIKEV